MKKNKKIKILIYGGCFDPVHKGHVYLLKKAIKYIKPDKIYIVPNSIPPLKNHDNYRNDSQRGCAPRVYRNQQRPTETAEGRGADHWLG